ncbi:MAG: thioesterase family protein [Rickettsiales bacterium]|jgi:acyl-CoA thioester hydrolase|nr:thioesterase family protein [Rickettsiales bacterium]
MPNCHKFPFAIAYADTDAGGIVYHARYIEIAERARMNWLRGRVPPDGDIGLVIRDLEVGYIKPLRLCDEFVVETEIGRGAASLTAVQKFVKDGEVYAVLTGRAAYVGADGRPKKIPDGYLPD